MCKTVQSSYGSVNGEVLRRLQNDFDTTRLFDAIEGIDRIRYRIGEAGAMRRDLVDLLQHGPRDH
jgi:hypothetical protein